MTPYYQDDAVTIFHGDCRDILPGLPKVDLVLTDPPYSESTHRGHLSTVADRQCLGFDSLHPQEYMPLIIKATFAWVIMTCDWHYMQFLEDSGWLVRFGIWIKPNGAPQFTGDRPGMGWEPVAIMHATRKNMVWNGGGKHGVWTYSRVGGLHPTEKPMALYKRIMTDFGGNTILDPFMGSGTTLRAAKDLGRKAIGIEIEEKYCDIAAQRMAQEVLPL